MIRAGLEPRVLAAAGVSSNQAVAVLSAANSHLAQHPTALRSADEAYAQARVSHDALERKVGSGLASQEEIGQLAAARTALASATAARASALQEIYAAATSGLNGQQAARLARLRANAAQKCPIEFKAVDRTEAEWVALRKALSNERVSAACGDTAHAGCQTLLASKRSDPSVASAKSACDSNLATIQSAWSTAVGG